MDQLIIFFSSHWVLSLLLSFVIIVIIVFEYRMLAVGPKKIDPKQAIQLINNDKAIVIDVRDISSFNKGHIINALNVSLSDVNDKMSKLSEYKKSPIIVVDELGSQAAVKIAELLSKNEFEKISILSGGVKAWKELHLPLEKS